jgi:RNA polymerase sigma-70 factor (ECF subfamily)
MDYSSTTANELAGLCADAGNQAAWQEFVHRFQRPIARVVLRTARGWGEPSTSLVDDLVQDTFLRLCIDECRLLRGFVSRQPDSILGYLKVIATNVTHDHFRAQASLKRGGDLRRVESESDETESLPAHARQVTAVEIDLQIDEIDRKMQGFPADVLTERDRTIFWLYYRQGFTARDIGEISAFGLTVKGVESSIHRTTALIKEVMQQPPSPTRAKGISTDSAIWKEGR